MVNTIVAVLCVALVFFIFKENLKYQRRDIYRYICYKIVKEKHGFLSTEESVMRESIDRMGVEEITDYTLTLIEGLIKVASKIKNNK
ncbi:MAG: hypothetical protein ACD_22C00204G0002 [uncultured bacterium]|nr:MAG: hypothetical protein ACD_22C00204G0002 [uncultured bacterium]